jgi:hypothetical protein
MYTPPATSLSSPLLLQALVLLCKPPSLRCWPCHAAAIVVLAPAATALMHDLLLLLAATTALLAMLLVMLLLLLVEQALLVAVDLPYLYCPYDCLLWLLLWAFLALASANHACVAFAVRLWLILGLAWLSSCTDSSILDDVLLDTIIKLFTQFLLMQLLFICSNPVTPMSY